MKNRDTLFSKRRSFSLKRGLALALSAVFLINQSASAGVAFPPLWAERKISSDKPLPPPPSSRQKILSALNQHGVIRSLPGDLGDGPLIILVQDVHGVLEAQKNIGAIIKTILSHEPNTLVGLEGAQGPLPLVQFRHENSWINQETAAFLLDHGLITGAEYAGLAAPGEPDFVGVEDAPLYLKNAEAVKHALKEKDRSALLIRNKLIELKKEKISAFSPEAMALDADADSFETGTLSLLSYVSQLKKTVSLKRGFPNLNRLWEASLVEASLNAEQIKEDQGRFLAALASSLSPKETGELAFLSRMVQNKSLQTAAYFTTLTRMAGDNGIDMAAYPAFHSYVNYLIETQAINPEALFEELARAEKKAWGSLCPTKECRALAEESRLVRLQQKLVNLAFTPKEWKRYSMIREKKSMAVFEAFYETALARDRAMARNFLLSNPSTGSPYSILVAGGFHTPGLQQLLSQDGADLLVVAPKFSPDEKASTAKYLNLFLDHPFPSAALFPILLHSLVMTLAVKPVEPAMNPVAPYFKTIVKRVQRAFEQAGPDKALQTRAHLDDVMADGATLRLEAQGVAVLPLPPPPWERFLGELSNAGRAMEQKLGDTLGLAKEWALSLLFSRPEDEAPSPSEGQNDALSSFGLNEAGRHPNEKDDLEWKTPEEIWALFLEEGHTRIEERIAAITDRTPAVYGKIAEYAWTHSVESLTKDLLSTQPEDIAWFFTNHEFWEKDEEGRHPRLAKIKKILAGIASFELYDPKPFPDTTEETRSVIEEARKNSASLTSRIVSSLGRHKIYTDILAAEIFDIVYFAGEISGYFKTGGIGMVADAHPKMLWGYGHNVTLVTPNYDVHPMRESMERLKKNPEVRLEEVNIWPGQEPAYIDVHNQNGPDVLLMNNEYYFGEEGMGPERDRLGKPVTSDVKNFLPYFGPQENGWRQIHNELEAESFPLERFIFFARHGVFTLPRLVEMGVLPRPPRILHIHDWHTAVIAPWIIYLQGTTLDRFRWDRSQNPHMSDISEEEFMSLKDFYKDTTVVGTIHNAAYQGLFSDVVQNKFPDQVNLFSYLLFQKTGLPRLPFFSNEKNLLNVSFEFHDKMNSLKLLVLMSHLITTVSPAHVNELTIPGDKGGYGFISQAFNDRRKAGQFIGILNGIGFDRTPERLPNIMNFPRRNYKKGKAANKRILLAEAGFPLQDDEDPADVMVFGMVGRMVHEKGWEFLVRMVESFDFPKDKKVFFIFTGGGPDRDLLQRLEKLNERGIHFYFRRGPDFKFSKFIQAGADAAYSPSFFEPCGLTHFEGMTLGTLPIVTPIGGLSVVEDLKTGFMIDVAPSLLALIKRYLDDRDPNNPTLEPYMDADINRVVERTLAKTHQAIDLYFNHPDQWDRMIQNIINKDYSWKTATDQYISAYYQAEEIREGLKTKTDTGQYENLRPDGASALTAINLYAAFFIWVIYSSLLFFNMESAIIAGGYSISALLGGLLSVYRHENAHRKDAKLKWSDLEWRGWHPLTGGIGFSQSKGEPGTQASTGLVVILFTASILTVLTGNYGLTGAALTLGVINLLFALSLGDKTEISSEKKVDEKRRLVSKTVLASPVSAHMELNPVSILMENISPADKALFKSQIETIIRIAQITTSHVVTDVTLSLHPELIDHTVKKAFLFSPRVVGWAGAKKADFWAEFEGDMDIQMEEVPDLALLNPLLKWVGTTKFPDSEEEFLKEAEESTRDHLQSYLEKGLAFADTWERHLETNPDDPLKFGVKEERELSLDPWRYLNRGIQTFSNLLSRPDPDESRGGRESTRRFLREYQEDLHDLEALPREDQTKLARLVIEALRKETNEKAPLLEKAVQKIMEENKHVLSMAFEQIRLNRFKVTGDRKANARKKRNESNENSEKHAYELFADYITGSPEAAEWLWHQYVAKAIQEEEKTDLSQHTDSSSSTGETMPLIRSSRPLWHLDLKQAAGLASRKTLNKDEVSELVELASHDHYWVRITALSRLVDIPLSPLELDPRNPEHVELKSILEAYKGMTQSLTRAMPTGDDSQAILLKARELWEEDQIQVRFWVNEYLKDPSQLKEKFMKVFDRDFSPGFLDTLFSRTPVDFLDAVVLIQEALMFTRVDERSLLVPTLDSMTRIENDSPYSPSDNRYFHLARWEKREPVLEGESLSLRITKRGYQLAPVVLLWQFAYDIAKMKSFFTEGISPDNLLGLLVDADQIRAMKETFDKNGEAIDDGMVRTGFSPFTQSSNGHYGAVVFHPDVNEIISVGYNGAPLAFESDPFITFTDLRQDAFMKNQKVSQAPDTGVQAHYNFDEFTQTPSGDLRDNRPDLRRSICAEQSAILFLIWEGGEALKKLAESILYTFNSPCAQCGEVAANTVRALIVQSPWPDTLTSSLLLHYFGLETFEQVEAIFHQGKRAEFQRGENEKVLYEKDDWNDLPQPRLLTTGDGPSGRVDEMTYLTEILSTERVQGLGRKFLEGTLTLEEENVFYNQVVYLAGKRAKLKESGWEKVKNYFSELNQSLTRGILRLLPFAFLLSSLFANDASALAQEGLRTLTEKESPPALNIDQKEETTAGERNPFIQNRPGSPRSHLNQA